MRVRQTFPLPFRIGLALLGAAIVSIAAYELSPGLRGFDVSTLWFGVILSGAVAIGGVLVVAAVIGEESAWELRPGELVVTRASPFRRRSRSVTAADQPELTVERHEWDSRADSFRIVLRLGAETLRSPDFETEASAQEAAAAIRARLNPASGP